MTAKTKTKKPHFFVTRRRLSIDLPDGSKLYFKEPVKDDILSEINALSSLNSLELAVYKEDKYLELFDTVEPEDSIYSPTNDTLPTRKKKRCHQEFLGFLTSAMIAPGAKYIDSWIDDLWLLGDSDLQQNGKGIYATLSEDFSYIDANAKLEKGSGKSLLELIFETCLLAIETEIDTIPDEEDFVSVKKFIDTHGELLGIHYQQLISIASNFLQKFQSVRRKF